MLALFPQFGQYLTCSTVGCGISVTLGITGATGTTGSGCTSGAAGSTGTTGCSLVSTNITDTSVLSKGDYVVNYVVDDADGNSYLYCRNLKVS